MTDEHTEVAVVPEKAALSKADVDAIEKCVMYGDFSALTQEQRLYYMKNLCEDLGVDMRLQPFQWIILNGKLTPYAKKSCADQLHRIHNISLQITEQKIMDGVYVAQVRATLPDGRYDEDIGAVPIDGYVGDALANGFKKAVTQAKRRVTYSIVGLGMLDETEIAQISTAQAPSQEGPRRITPPSVRPTLPDIPRHVDPPPVEAVIVNTTATPIPGTTKLPPAAPPPVGKLPRA